MNTTKNPIIYFVIVNIFLLFHSTIGPIDRMSKCGTLALGAAIHVCVMTTFKVKVVLRRPLYC